MTAFAQPRAHGTRVPARDADRGLGRDEGRGEDRHGRQRHPGHEVDPQAVADRALPEGTQRGGGGRRGRRRLLEHAHRVVLGGDVQRPALHLLVDAADVGPEDAEAEQLHAGEQQDHDGHRGPARHGPAHDEVDDDGDRPDQRHDSGHQPEHGRRSQRRGAERGQAVDRQAHHAPQGVLGLTGGAHLPAVVDDGARVPEPGDEQPVDAVPLRQATQRLDHPPAHQAVVADARRHLDAGRALHQSVVQGGGAALEGRVAAAVGPAGVDDVDAGVLRRPQHRGQQLGRVLQVGVHRGHPLPARPVEARGQRHLVADVPVQPHDPELGPAGRRSGQRVGGAVGRPVVDGQHLVGHAERVEHPPQPGDEDRQHLGLVEAGDDHAERRARRRGHGLRSYTSIEPSVRTVTPSPSTGRAGTGSQGVPPIRSRWTTTLS